MLLDGKRGLILGIANKRSIAWGIAQAAHREGARLAVTYQGERLEENVRELAAQLRDPLVLPCDVSKDDDLEGARGLGPRGARRARLRGPRGGLRPARGARRRVREHLARGLPPRPGHLLLLAHGSRPRDGAPHGGRRQHRDPELPRRRAGGAQLQRDGRRQGRARDVRALPRGRPRPEGNPGERHLRRPDQDPRRLGRPRPLEDARVPPHPRPAAQDHRSGGGRRRRALPALATSPGGSPAR